MAISRRVARFNRVFANHLVGPILTRLPGFGTVHHLGRRSGKEYRTPVKVFRSGEAYVITLPYGPNSDWVRNVLAADGCGLMTRGRYVQLTDPALVENDGLTALPVWARAMMSWLHTTTSLRLFPVRPV
ncbi:nitroreductase family deazaflavin-dependent oxidoreductase [Geodermatophilus sp. SYSU D01176]